MPVTLILGSAPMATVARDWPRMPFDRVLAINNAHAIRPDWDELIYPHDFPVDRIPALRPGQHHVTETEFVPAQNALGGFVYAGGTMAFTAAYYALFSHQSTVIAVFGCDMVYPRHGKTHFYCQGTA
ncbi:MAG: hypothetical protein U1E06_21550, partial [Tabrizicola sp.]|nr:hypothetical protein [Tabrizicola sp.]